MNIGERIRIVRGDMNQEMFGERIGVSKYSISTYESEKRAITSRVISDICREFGINEEWLRTGEGDIYAPKTSETLLADVIAKNGLEGYARTIIEGFFTLSPSQRQAIQDYIAQVVREMKNTAPKDGDENDVISMEVFAAAHGDQPYPGVDEEDKEA